MKSLWKVVDVIIDTRLRSNFHLHDVLHGLCAGRVTGTDILELNLTQELARFEQDPLLLVFLDLRKAYDTVDWGRLLANLEVYGAGPHMCKLLAVFWDQQEFVTLKNR